MPGSFLLLLFFSKLQLVKKLINDSMMCWDSGIWILALPVNPQSLPYLNLITWGNKVLKVSIKNTKIQLVFDCIGALEIYIEWSFLQHPLRSKSRDSWLFVAFQSFPIHLAVKSIEKWWMALYPIDFEFITWHESAEAGTQLKPF